MATYVNNLRLKEITTGDEDGTWGTSTNTNLELITDGFSYGTKEIAADANETFTMPDATADATRSLYLKFTSAVSLRAQQPSQQTTWFLVMAHQQYKQLLRALQVMS
jgi:hypothetical protein